MQKIAMLGHKQIPSRAGGIEVVVEILSTAMAARGHRVTCYNRGGHGGRLHHKGVEVKPVPTLNRKGLGAVTSSFFAALYAALGNFDVVHFHGEGPCVMLWLPKLLGKKCVVTVHGLDWQREKWKGSVAPAYIRLGEAIAAKYADEVIVLSQNTQAYFRQTYGRKTHWIPNGIVRPIPLEAFRICQIYGLKKREYILFLGRLVPEKGIHYLLEAYRSVRTDKKLVIAGGPSDTEAYVRELEKMGEKEDRILFTGFVSGEILEELYSNAYLYVLPSDLEGMPLSLLEAMSYGNCCLVSNIPECREVVENNGVIFEKGNREALREKLQFLCDHPEVVQTYRNTAAEFICGKYSWEYVVERTLEVYQ